MFVILPATSRDYLLLPELRRKWAWKRGECEAAVEAGKRLSQDGRHDGSRGLRQDTLRSMFRSIAVAMAAPPVLRLPKLRCRPWTYRRLV